MPWVLSFRCTALVALFPCWMPRDLRALLALTLAIASVGISSKASAQGTKADYDRSNALPELVSGKVLRGRLETQWLPGNEGFWYRRDLAPNKAEYVKVKLEDGTMTPLFDQAELAQA